jgi:hypothetical protein
VPDAGRHIPAEIEGCRVKLVQSGPFRKLES